MKKAESILRYIWILPANYFIPVFLFVFSIKNELLVMEKTNTCKCHCHVVLVGFFNYVVIAN